MPVCAAHSLVRVHMMDLMDLSSSQFMELRVLEFAGKNWGTKFVFCPCMALYSFFHSFSCMFFCLGRWASCCHQLGEEASFLWAHLEFSWSDQDACGGSGNDQSDQEYGGFCLLRSRGENQALRRQAISSEAATVHSVRSSSKSWGTALSHRSILS